MDAPSLAFSSIWDSHLAVEECLALPLAYQMLRNRDSDTTGWARFVKHMQVFGNSPDETAFCRLVLNKETTREALLMLQPELMAYMMGVPEPQPVQLDVGSIHPEHILLLDSYFYVVVFHGSNVATWRKADYHLQPEHAAFKTLLEAPPAQAEYIVKHRFPVPKLVICDQNGSQARFLLARLNPSATYSSPSGMSAEIIMTDDVSLQVFLDHLRKLAVQS